MTNLESWQPPEPVEFEHDGSFMLQLDYPDYLASGETPEEARLNFWKGLALTLWERGKAGLPLDGHPASDEPSREPTVEQLKKAVTGAMEALSNGRTEDGARILRECFWLGKADG